MTETEYEMTETVFEKLQNAEFWTNEARSCVKEEDVEAIERARKILVTMMLKYKDC